MPEKPAQVLKPPKERAGTPGCSLTPSIILMVLVHGPAGDPAALAMLWTSAVLGPVWWNLGRRVDPPTFFLQKIFHREEWGGAVE